MSTAKFDTLQNAAGSVSVPVNTVVNGSAKAWVNFNGTGTVAIRAGFNVSSITDNGVGNYNINFTAAMADANYSIVATTVQRTGVTLDTTVSTGAPGTAGVEVYPLSAGTQFDSTYVFAAVFR